MALSPQALFKGLVSRAVPSRNPDSFNNDVALRQGSYGEIYNQPLVRKAHNLADEGTYFTANNAQTGIAMTAGATFSATAPFIVITNNASVASGTRCYLDYINLVSTAAGGAASTLVSLNATVVIDSTLRYTSGGTTLARPVNPNMDSATASISTVYCGAITSPAASGSARTIVGNRVIRPAVSATVMTVVGDSINLNFGGVEGGANGSITVANASIIPVSLPPIVIGPQSSALIYLWQNGATTPTAASFTPEVGLWER
jgi:hypothetical protein